MTLKTLFARWWRKPTYGDPANGVRIISGPVQVEIDGQLSKWTPRMEAEVSDYMKAVNAASANRSAAEATYRKAMAEAVAKLKRAQEE